MAPTTDRQQFRALVADVAARAKEKLPQAVNGRIESAVKLVLGQDVYPQADGSILVGSSSDPMKTYLLVGSTCECQDFVHDKAPEGWCQHRIAAGIQKRVQQLLPMDGSPGQAPAGIDPRHIVQIQGRPFVKFAGLLELAHKRGLQSLKVDWTANEAELSLAHAVAVFPFGTFEESADSTPLNVGTKVALHWRRLSLTRAKARVLRDALSIDMVALEELGDE